MRSLKKGFTLVELSLSLAFIGILSITIVLIINNAITTYRRGLTLNQINTVGMDLVDDMRAAVQNSPAKAVVELCDGIDDDSAREACKNDDGEELVSVVENSIDLDGLKVKGKVTEGVPMYGAFCTGAYSYVWNSGYLFMEDDSEVKSASVSYSDKDSSKLVDAFRLIKVQDRNRSVCKSVLEWGGSKDRGEFDAGQLDEEPEILLGADENSALALYDLSSAVPAVNDNGTSAFYSISFILGTVQGGINVMSNGNFCATPDEYDSNFDYCAINKFNFAAQANGG